MKSDLRVASPSPQSIVKSRSRRICSFSKATDRWILARTAHSAPGSALSFSFRNLTCAAGEKLTSARQSPDPNKPTMHFSHVTDLQIRPTSTPVGSSSHEDSSHFGLRIGGDCSGQIFKKLFHPPLSVVAEEAIFFLTPLLDEVSLPRRTAYHPPTASHLLANLVLPFLVLLLLLLLVLRLLLLLLFRFLRLRRSAEETRSQSHPTTWGEKE